MELLESLQDFLVSGCFHCRLRRNTDQCCHYSPPTQEAINKLSCVRPGVGTLMQDFLRIPSACFSPGLQGDYRGLVEAHISHILRNSQLVRVRVQSVWKLSLPSGCFHQQLSEHHEAKCSYSHQLQSRSCRNTHSWGNCVSPSMDPASNAFTASRSSAEVFLMPSNASTASSERCQRMLLWSARTPMHIRLA